jgi:O-antigen/teichoic acid export membrane protein
MVKKIVEFSLWDNIWRQLTASLAMAILGIIFQQTASQGWTQFFALGVGLCVTYAVVILLVGKRKLHYEIRSLNIFKKKVSPSLPTTD